MNNQPFWAKEAREEGLDLQVLATKALKSQSYGFHLDLKICLHVLVSLFSKFDPKPIATLSKPNFRPSYLEPSKSPKLP